jgi:O-antigen ligase
MGRHSPSALVESDSAPGPSSKSARSGRGVLPAVQANMDETTPRQQALSVVVVALVFVLLAYPTIALAAPSAADYILAIAALLLVPSLLARIRPLIFPALCLLALVVIYGLSTLYEQDAAVGLRHTTAVASFGVAFLVFACFGSDLVALRWFPTAAVTVVGVDVGAILLWGIKKNASGGALIYLFAILLVLMMARGIVPGWLAATAFTLGGVGVFYYFEFRFIAICSLVFLLVYMVSGRLPRKAYFLLGIVASVSVIWVTIWFFLNVDRGGTARRLGHLITEATGRRATSGRDYLWPHILSAADDNRIFGLGAGTLPSQVVGTRLSSHNYFLQVYLQVGLLGLTSVILFLLAIWWLFVGHKSDVGRFGAALFIMFVVHNSTEVLLLQNNAGVALPAWCAIGLALSIDRSMDRGTRQKDAEPELMTGRPSVTW